MKKICQLVELDTTAWPSSAEDFGVVQPLLAGDEANTRHHDISRHTSPFKATSATENGPKMHLAGLSVVVRATWVGDPPWGPAASAPAQSISLRKLLAGNFAHTIRELPNCVENRIHSD